MIVKRVRAVGQGLGQLFDEEDRRAIGMVAVIVATVLLAAVTLALAGGLAIRVFGVASGL